ncbi:MAG: GNAT family N-acetyltransferase [Bermanella sp.]
MNQTELKLQEWSGENFRAVNRFYRSQKHKGSASGDERVFVIYQNEDIMAAVRLVPYQGYYWLRSLYVSSELRGLKLGSQLLTRVQQCIELPIYCFPYPHLLSFYQQAQYQLLEPMQMPESLQQLYKRYSGKGTAIICMGLNL